MRYIFSLIIAIAFSFQMNAQKLVTASCTEGKGCKFTLSDYDHSTAAYDDLKDLKPDGIVIVGKKKNGEEVLYYENDKSRSQIDREWGGDGYTQLYMFDPTIEPISGDWKVVFGTATGNECYGIGDVGSFIRGMIAPGLSNNNVLKFSRPFSPSVIFPTDRFAWSKVGYNKYYGEMIDMPGNTAGFNCTMTIVSQEKITMEWNFHISVPTQGTCRGKVPATLTLVSSSNPKIKIE